MKLNKDGTIDIRVLSPEEQAFMRNHIALKFGRGDKCPKISADLNVQLHYVERVCLSVKLNGEKSVELKKMGRPVGSNGVLTNKKSRLKIYSLKQRRMSTDTPAFYGITAR